MLWPQGWQPTTPAMVSFSFRFVGKQPGRATTPRGGIICIRMAFYNHETIGFARKQPGRATTPQREWGIIYILQQQKQWICKKTASATVLKQQNHSICKKTARPCNYTTRGCKICIQIVFYNNKPIRFIRKQLGQATSKHVRRIVCIQMAAYDNTSIDHLSEARSNCLSSLNVHIL